MTNLLVCGVVIHCLSMTLFQTPRYIFLQYGSEHNPAKKTKNNYKTKSVSLTSRVDKCASGKSTKITEQPPTLIIQSGSIRSGNRIQALSGPFVVIGLRQQ